MAETVMRWPRDRLSSQDSQWCLRTSRVQIPSPALIEINKETRLEHNERIIFESLILGELDERK